MNLMKIGRMATALVFPLFFVGVVSQLPACLDDLKAGGGADAGDDAQGCGHAMPPLPPSGSDDPSKDITFVTAIRKLSLPTGGKDETLGFDLDRFCSCQGETPSCIAPAYQDPDLQCDGLQGRDNGAYGYFQLVSTMLLLNGPSGLQDFFSEMAYLGKWSILMRVSGYNGLADDPTVRVDWIPSYGTSTPPQWLGSDVWSSAVGALDPDGGPRYYDNLAYVNNGKLVFSLAEADIEIGDGKVKFDMYIRDSTVMATIQQDAVGRYHLADGVVAGRIPLEELFKMVTNFRDHNEAPFCASGQNPYFASTRLSFCRGPDIQVGPAQPNKKCDAISIGVGFQAEPVADVGMPEAAPPQTYNCQVGEDPYSVFLDAGCPPEPPKP